MERNKCRPNPKWEEKRGYSPKARCIRAPENAKGRQDGRLRCARKEADIIAEKHDKTDT